MIVLFCFMFFSFRPDCSVLLLFDRSFTENMILYMEQGCIAKHILLEYTPNSNTELGSPDLVQTQHLKRLVIESMISN